MTKSKLITGFLFLFISVNVLAQNIAITDDNGYSAESTAMLDIKSISKGLLIPRLDSLQRVGINSPATGLLVFDTDASAFFYYDGSDWLNLTTNVISPSSATVNDVLFSVINTNGDTVFAVYPEGVQINVGDGAKANKGGFAVGGLASGKLGQSEFLRVTADSVRIYIDTTTGTKANKGGFAVGGLASGKALGQTFLSVSDDSVRIYLDTTGTGKANKGGFAVGGLASGKGVITEYMKISSNASADVIDPSEARFLWYPTKEAFLVGRVLVEDPNNVGTNSFVTGFESKASGDYSQAMGYQSYAIGNYSTAIGNYAEAQANNSFAFGDNAQAIGEGSYAIGSVGRDTATGASTGVPTKASGDYSIAIGMGSWATATGAIVFGTNSSAYGSWSTAIGNDCHASSGALAIGNGAYATGYKAVALGESSVEGDGSVAGGLLNDVYGSNSVAFGAENFIPATAYTAVALGGSNASRDYSTIAIGYSNDATTDGNVAIGYDNMANGSYCTALGILNTSSGIASLALGYSTTASGDYSTSLGQGITVSGTNSFGVALNDQSSTTLSQNNTFAIMGGKVGIGTIAPSHLLSLAPGDDLTGLHINHDQTATGITKGIDIDLDNTYSGTNQTYGIFSEVRRNGTSAANTFGGYFYGLDYQTSSTRRTYGVWAQAYTNSTSGTSYAYGVYGYVTGNADYQYGVYGNTAAATNKYAGYFSGNLHVTGTTTKASDLKLKSNINPLENTLSKLMLLKPVSYTYKTDDYVQMNFAEGKRMGLIAQDLQEVFPELVSKHTHPGSDENVELGIPKTEATEYLGIDYIELIPILIQSIKEQQKMIDNLKMRDLEKEKQIEILKMQLIELQNK